MTLSQIRHNRKIVSKIMSEAWLAGYNVKELAGYFNINISGVYRLLPIRDLKVKKARRIAEKLNIS